MNEKKYCTDCGHPYEAGDRFCQQCGTRLPFEEAEVTVKTMKKGVGKKIAIALIALFVVAAGSVVGYSTFAKSFSPEKVIKNTLALESGKIKYSITVDNDGYSEKEKGSIDFIKKGDEKTLLFRSDYDPFYFSIKDGVITTVSYWGEDEFDLKSETGIDVAKLERELVSYLAETFKGKEVPEKYINNVEKKRVDGKYVLTFDVGDEIKLIEWIYDCFDLRLLRNVVEDNIVSNEFKEEFRDIWEDVLYGLDSEMGYLFYELGDSDIRIKTSAKVVVDKKRILDEIELRIDMYDTYYEEDYKFVLNLSIDDKNDVDTIRKPTY